MEEALEIVIVLLLAVAAFTDLRFGKIYNWLTFPAIVVGIFFRIFWMKESWIAPVLPVVTAFTIFFPLFWIRAMAAGDVKLLMAVGAWSRPESVLYLAVIAIFLGALVGLALLLKGGRLKRKISTLTAMPFAPAFLGAFFVMKVGEHYRWFS